MVVLVVGCGNYTGLAGVDGVVDGVAAMKRRLVEEGAEVRTLEGKVTERRLERALRSIGKRARRGERAGIVLIGHSVAGGFAVENTEARKPGKRMRIFSPARVAHLLGGAAFEGGVAMPRVHVPVMVLPPLGPPQGPPGGLRGGLGGLSGGGSPGGWSPGDPLPGGDPMPDPFKPGWDPTGRKKKSFFDPRWKRRIDRWLGVGTRGQIDPGYNGFRWVVNAAGVLENCPWEVGSLAFVEVRFADRRGLLEIQEHDEFRREIWRFEGNGSWPLSDFTLGRILSTQVWSIDDLQAARQWPVAHQLDWKGFQAQAGPPLTLSTAFRLRAPNPPSAPENYVPPTAYARTQTAGQVRIVVGWTGNSSQDVGFVGGVIEAKHVSQVTLLFPYPPM
jgi:hypothetical protein